MQHGGFMLLVSQTHVLHIISCVHSQHSKAGEWMSSLYPFWCDNGGKLGLNFAWGVCSKVT